jgi:hypothetical protein
MSPQQAPRSASGRPAAPLGRHLERRLLAYVVAASGAGLLSAALPAEAEVIYTPCNTPMNVAVLNQGAALTPLDLDNDGKPDFSFAMFYGIRSSIGGTILGFKSYLKIVPQQNGNAAVQGQRGPTAPAMAKGDQIGPSQRFGNRDLYLYIDWFGSANQKSGSWNRVEYAYVGLKFMIGGQVHYGWARVKFPFSGRGTRLGSISGYAYESTPNQPIVAGQTTGVAPEGNAENLQGTLGMLAAGSSAVNVWRAGNSSPDAH